MALVAVIFGLPVAAQAESPALLAPVAQNRSVEPVVLTGSQLTGWSAGPEISAGVSSQPPTSDCYDDTGDGLSHNCSEPSLIPNNPNTGVPVDQLLGYRWDAASRTYEQIPFQVDERFTRYISNHASNCNAAGPFCVGFGAYAGTDAQLTYAYDRDSYKFIAGECSAEMPDGERADPDPVVGLDDNDELSFLYRDTGALAPTTAPLPAGVSELRAIRIDDASAPGAAARYAYVGRSSSVAPRYTRDNGYMRYERDADADHYEETSDGYGNAPRGTVCNAQGQVIGSDVPRRPRDTAWVSTPRYAFRYDGRWILRGVRVAPGDRDEPLDDPSGYGPALIDQWKARAYAQTKEDEVPCCGFETEQYSWGGSSVTLGERSGPVRVIRTTWGADSGTNTVRNEILYPDVIVQQTNLRVHPIPPLGGIFSYWDHGAGVITKYYNPQVPDGVDVDGRNDEIVGTAHVEFRDDGIEIRDDDPIPLIGPVKIGDADGACLGECANFDVTDPTLNALGTLSWEQVSGPHGSMVFRTTLGNVNPGDAQSLASIPYYRDDACFDDGTGIDPGPRRNDASDTTRPCWTPGDPAPSPAYRQGLIGAHGVQILMAAETDNLMVPAPLNEISAETRMVILPGDPGFVGERYALASDLPLVTTALGATPSILPTTLDVTGASTGRIGDHTQLAATLTDALGPVGDAPVRFDFQGMTYAATSDADGVATVSDVPVVGPAGATDIVATYDGDMLRSPASATEPFTVEKGSAQLTFTADSDTTAKAGHDTTFAAKLEDGDGPIGGATVEVTFQGTTRDATTDAAGIATVGPVPVAGPAGDFPVTASYDGDATHDAAQADDTFTVEADDTDVAFTPASDDAGQIGHAAHFVARLTDSAGPLTGAPVRFTFQGASHDATTDADGIASTDAQIDGPSGTTQVTAAFAGDGSHTAASASRPFEVTKDAGHLVFEPGSATTGTIGERATFVAKLTAAQGPVSGTTLRFDVQGQTHEARTDANGVGSVRVVLTGPSGPTTVTVRDDGSAMRAPSSADSEVDVAKRASSISFTAKSGSNGNVTVRVRLSDPVIDDYLADRTVRVLVDGHQMDTVVTDSDGQASGTFKLAKPKGKTFTVAFAGDDTYRSVEAEGVFGKKGASGTS